MEKQDEIIIQNKIDGTLSAREEERFNELIKTSPEARRLYHNLANLQHSLEDDSMKIPTIDLSQGIMQAVEARQGTQSPAPKKPVIFTLTYRSQLLAYAAMLVVGLVIGSIAMYIGAGSKTPANRDISGTMAKNTGTDYYYSEAGTEIKVQGFKSDEFQIVTIAVNTVDSIYCVIPGDEKRLPEEIVTPMFSDGKFQLSKEHNSELTYLCRGKVIFLATKNDNFKPLNVRFIKQDKMVYEFEPE